MTIPSSFHLKAGLYHSIFPFTSLAILPESRNYLCLRQRKLTTTTKTFGIYTCYRQWVHIWKYNYFKVIRLYNTGFIFSFLTKNPQTKQTDSSTLLLGLGSPEKKGSHISLVDFHLISVCKLLCILSLPSTVISGTLLFIFLK